MIIIYIWKLYFIPRLKFIDEIVATFIFIKEYLYYLYNKYIEYNSGFHDMYSIVLKFYKLRIKIHK